MKTVWSVFKALLNSKQIGSVITRKEIMTEIRAELDGAVFSQATVDTIRNMCTQTKYLYKIGVNGMYIVRKHLEPEMTTFSLRAKYDKTIRVFKSF